MVVSNMKLMQATWSQIRDENAKDWEEEHTSHSDKVDVIEGVFFFKSADRWTRLETKRQPETNWCQLRRGVKCKASERSRWKVMREEGNGWGSGSNRCTFGLEGAQERERDGAGEKGGFT